MPNVDHLVVKIEPTAVSGGAAGRGWLVVLSVAARAVKEECVLRDELLGYDAYAARVRYRLLPGIW